MIPRLIHQTWKNTEIPAPWLPLQRSWREHHPDWEYRFWTDLSLRELIEGHYAWFLPIYDGYPIPIMRVDAARYFLMHHHGGVYVDMDFESLRPVDGLLTDKEVVFGHEPAAHLDMLMTRDRGLEGIVCNAFIASRPGHPFWEHVFRELAGAHKEWNPLDATGPFFLTRALRRYPQPQQITVAPAELLYPISQQERALVHDPAARARLAHSAFAIHHWSGSWWPAMVAQGGQAGRRAGRGEK